MCWLSLRPHLVFLICGHFLLSWLFSLIREGLEASPGAAAEAGGQWSHRPESLQDGFCLWG